MFAYYKETIHHILQYLIRLRNYRTWLAFLRLATYLFLVSNMMTMEISTLYIIPSEEQAC
jgi:hypothetical protein